MKKSAKAVFAAVCALSMCLTEGCANKAEVVLPDGQTSQVELEKGGEVIDPFQYFDITFSGFNGYGTASAERTSDSSFEIVLDKRTGLSNGDIVTATVKTVKNISPDVASPAYKEIEVTGLEEQQELDPFKDLQLSIQGISPMASVSLDTSQCEDTVKKYISFSLEDTQLFQSSLQNAADGDIVTVTAAYDEIRLGELGFRVTENSKEYTVSCSEKYMTYEDDIDFSELDKGFQDFMEAQAAGALGSYHLFGISTYYVTEITEIKDLGKSWFMSMKTVPSGYNSDPYNIYLKLYMVSGTCRSFSGQTEERSVYVITNVKNISTDENGGLLYSGQSFAPSLISYNSNTELPTLEAKTITSRKSDYNITEIN